MKSLFKKLPKKAVDEILHQFSGTNPFWDAMSNQTPKIMMIEVKPHAVYSIPADNGTEGNQ